jgi:hypothetical protein
VLMLMLMLLACDSQATKHLVAALLSLPAGDLNTMAHGIARLSKDYCCDSMRLRCAAPAYPDSKVAAPTGHRQGP